MTATETTAGTVPVPVKPITVVPDVEELLVMVSWPVTAPAVTGSNAIFRIAC